MEPIYENLEFHRVKISVPGSRKPMLLTDRAPTVVNTRIVKRKQRVNKATGRPCGVAKSGLETNNNNVSESNDRSNELRKFEKFGYSRNEVWNWLYTDEDENEDAAQTTKPELVPERLRDLYSVPQKAYKTAENGRTVEVRFSPHEFVTASSRLEHLDLNGLEEFVGNTLEKAMAKRQKQRHEQMRKQKLLEQEQNVTSSWKEGEEMNVDSDHTVTITHVPEHSLDVRTATTASNGCCCHLPSSGPAAARSAPTATKSAASAAGTTSCQTCAGGGESTCSSALSSLESVRSSHSSASHGLKSNSGSETLASELNNNSSICSARSKLGRPPVSAVASAKGPAPSKPMRSSVQQQRKDVLTYEDAAATKPYQTLEVSYEYIANGGICHENHNGKIETLTRCLKKLLT
jgi:hypothetical protein